MIIVQPFNYQEYDVVQHGYEDHGDSVRIVALGTPTSAYHIRVIQDDNGQVRRIYFNRIYAAIWATRIGIELTPELIATALREQAIRVIDRVWAGEAI